MKLMKNLLLIFKMEAKSQIITNIEKSKSDKFDCQIRILSNDLKALLVSDSEA